jgi:hypothetical protein
LRQRSSDEEFRGANINHDCIPAGGAAIFGRHQISVTGLALPSYAGRRSVAALPIGPEPRSDAHPRGFAIANERPQATEQTDALKTRRSKKAAGT